MARMQTTTPEKNEHTKEQRKNIEVKQVKMLGFLFERPLRICVNSPRWLLLLSWHKETICEVTKAANEKPSSMAGLLSRVAAAPGADASSSCYLCVPPNVVA